MRIENILKAEAEVKRFLGKLKELKTSDSNIFAFTKKDKNSTTYSSKESGALKRASMDLTRALSKMRNETY